MKEEMRTRVDALMQRLDADLKLKSEQQSEIREIMSGFMEKRKMVKTKHGEDKEGRKAAMKELRQEMRQRIGKTLDANQRNTFKTNRKEYRSLIKG
jgi:hypothetical protein